MKERVEEENCAKDEKVGSMHKVRHGYGVNKQEDVHHC